MEISDSNACHGGLHLEHPRECSRRHPRWYQERVPKFCLPQDRVQQWLVDHINETCAVALAEKDAPGGFLEQWDFNLAFHRSASWRVTC